jgi:hypothetical protein
LYIKLTSQGNDMTLFWIHIEIPTQTAIDMQMLDYIQPSISAWSQTPRLVFHYAWSIDIKSKYGLEDLYGKLGISSLTRAKFLA